MPFPFLPAGVALALAVLGGAFTIFWLLVRVLDRAARSARDAAVSTRDAMAPGLVAGLRTWGRDPGAEGRDEARRTVDPGSRGAPASGADALEEGPRDAVPGGPVVNTDPRPGWAGEWSSPRELAQAEELKPDAAIPTEPVHRG